MKKRLLILEDGSIYEGKAFGGNNYQLGELVFETGMEGYQETLSDLTYSGQIVMMTYPMIGNTGINRDDFESLNAVVFGLVCKECCEEPSNFRSTSTLDEYLKMKDIPGIQDIDTRSITRKLRDKGTMKAIMCDEDANTDEIIKMLKSSELPKNLVAQVSTQQPYSVPARGNKVVVIDNGTKYGVIRELSVRHCDLVVVPYNMPLAEILALRPDGVVISDGPGCPEELEEEINTIKELIKVVPVFGIALGHQLICLACGAKAYKMKFGHRGTSHPIRNMKTGRIEFTAQNHGYAIDEASLENTELELTYKALNDNTVEGAAHKTLPVFGVQFNPEAAPGPEDCKYVFDEFSALMNVEGIVK
ncbi:MAG: glutamine-hydrolyzing carbamoyl-phosphate synthase small subunit [Erysipelotrichaceae bacterium]